jgi:hypothetical protein
LHAQRLGRSVALIVVVLGSATTYVLLSRSTAFALSAVIAGAAALALLIGMVIVERRFPLPFDFEPHGDDVSFDFRDLSVAYEFRAINAPVTEAGGLTSA